MFRLILTLILCISNAFIYAQSKYAKKNFAYHELLPVEIPEKFKHHDAVILQEESFYNYNASSLKKHIRIKYLNAQGIARFNKLCLPESIDIAGDQYSVPRYKFEKTHYPLGSADIILYFNARIIKPDGRIIEAKVRDSIVNHKIADQTVIKNFFNYYFIIQNLEPGDELDLYYAHREKFYSNVYYRPEFSNWRPNRIFMHSSLPKVKYKLSLSFDNESALKFSYTNCKAPSDTATFVDNQTMYYTTYTWNYENLVAIVPTGSQRLYNDLPNIKYYSAASLTRSVNDQSVEKIEFPWSFAVAPLTGVKKNYSGYDYTFSSVTALNALYKKIITDCPDSSYIKRVEYFHEYINSEFLFLLDTKYFEGEDQGNLRVGEFVKEKKLREATRSYVYKEILDRFDRNYYKMVISDKRADKIDHKKFNYGFSIPGYYGLVDNGNLFLLRAKNHQFGHHINEIPFYYENCNIVLVPQRVPEDEYVRYFYYLPNIIHHNTPSSNEGDNMRKTFVYSKVDLSNKNVSFDIKLNLSGQFSTLTRGFYSHRYIDSSINPLYYHPVYQMSKHSKKLSLTEDLSERTFPYRNNLRIQSSDAKLLSSSDDIHYQMDLKNFIVHVLEEMSNNQSIPYYPDFRQTDTYKYMLKFDHPVELTKQIPEIKINNSMGTYNFSIKQINPDEILIDSYLQVITEKIPVDKLNDANAVVQASRQSSDFKLEFKKVQ